MTSTLSVALLLGGISLFAAVVLTAILLDATQAWKDRDFEAAVLGVGFATAVGLIGAAAFIAAVGVL